MHVAFGLLFLCGPVFALDVECQRWFLESGIKTGAKDCVLRCKTLSTGMDSYMCPLQCEGLCKTVIPRYLLDQLTYPPNLTDADRDLISKFPKEALQAFYFKMRDEDRTEKLFLDNGHDDESDAFRHFVWAGLLAQNLGKEKAHLFLQAHERRSDQPQQELEMDSHNNMLGVETGLQLKSEMKSSQEELEKTALDFLKKGKLRVSSPGGRIPEWRY